MTIPVARSSVGVGPPFARRRGGAMIAPLERSTVVRIAAILALSLVD